MMVFLLIYIVIAVAFTLLFCRVCREMINDLNTQDKPHGNEPN